jgi:phenylacetate-coenzyme A ligase PaaK-like adenylate-forming protein
MIPNFDSSIFTIDSENTFNEYAIRLFQYQSVHCTVYASFIKHLGIQPHTITHYSQIPCLPISFFKSHTVVSSSLPVETIFESSKTTGTIASKHYIPSLNIYRQSFMTMFKRIYGNPQEYIFFALLPSYLERSNSSLVYMIQHLIQESQNTASGFYLNNFDDLHNAIQTYSHSNIFLIGVTFALLDFAEQYTCNHNNLIVMETGGMKGRKKEMIRSEVHEILQKSFGVSHIHSEYGMTELLSQAYALRNGEFTPAPWMKVLIRDMYDPRYYVPNGTHGGINIIDLANWYSCAFIETQDIGRILHTNTFSVEGRIDSSDIRGCNLMVQS